MTSTEVWPPADSPLGEYYAWARTEVGRTSQTRLGVVDELWIRRFARTVGAPDPVVDGVVVAPPNFLAAVHEWGVGAWERDLGVDGLPRGLGDRAAPLRSMGAGEDMEFVAPVVAGMDLTLTTTLESVVAKRGRRGHSVFETVLNEFRVTDGHLLNRNRRTVVRRNPIEQVAS